jgi:hypothetical protein
LHKEKKKFPKEKGSFLQEQFTFFGEGPKVSKKKGNFPKEQCTFPKGSPSSLGNILVLNFFVITFMSCLSLFRLVTYYRKGLKEGYNFVIGSTSIIICMKKLRSHKISNKFAP